MVYSTFLGHTMKPPWVARPKLAVNVTPPGWMKTRVLLQQRSSRLGYFRSGIRRPFERNDFVRDPNR